MVKEGACSHVGHRKSCRKGYLEHLLFWCSEKKQSPRYGGEMVQEFSDSVFFHSISPPCLGLCFFSVHQNGKCSRYPFLQFFRTRVLDTP